MNKSIRTPKPVFFRKGGGWKSVSTDAIVCMEANASKCKFYMADGTELIVEMPLVTALNKTREQNDVFLRIHRSFAVNVEHIDIFYNDSLIMKNEMRVPIGRLYRDILPGNLTIIDKRDRTSDEDEQIDKRSIDNYRLDSVDASFFILILSFQSSSSPFVPCQINLRFLTLFIRKILENARFMLKIKFNYFLP